MRAPGRACAVVGSAPRRSAACTAARCVRPAADRMARWVGSRSHGPSCSTRPPLRNIESMMARKAVGDGRPASLVAGVRVVDPAGRAPPRDVPPGDPPHRFAVPPAQPAPSAVQPPRPRAPPSSRWPAPPGRQVARAEECGGGRSSSGGRASSPRSAVAVSGWPSAANWPSRSAVRRPRRGGNGSITTPPPMVRVAVASRSTSRSPASAPIGMVERQSRQCRIAGLDPRSVQRCDARHHMRRTQMQMHRRIDAQRPRLLRQQAQPCVEPERSVHARRDAAPSRRVSRNPSTAADR